MIMINEMKLMTHGPACHQDLVDVGVPVTAPVSLWLLREPNTG